jgi:hypothetical protein
MRTGQPPPVAMTTPDRTCAAALANRSPWGCNACRKLTARCRWLDLEYGPFIASKHYKHDC